MNKSQAIRLKCLDCSGDTPKEVTLCHIVDCSLWQYRFGCSSKSKQYKQRMEKAKKRYSMDYQEMLKALSEHCKNMPNLPEYLQIDAFFKNKSAEQCNSSPLGLNA